MINESADVTGAAAVPDNSDSAKIEYVKYDITIGGGWGQVRGAASQYCCYHCVIR